MGERTERGWEGLEPYWERKTFLQSIQSASLSFISGVARATSPEECLGKRVIFQQALSYPE